MKKWNQDLHKLTPYNEPVCVEIVDCDNSPIKRTFHENISALPDEWLNQIILVERRGSHSWQPIEPLEVYGFGGVQCRYPNIYPYNVGKVYRKSEYPEMFL